MKRSQQFVASRLAHGPGAWRLLMVAALMVVARQTTADPPTRIANQARLDVLAESAVGELRDFRLAVGDGDAQRMDWIDKAQQSGSITASFTIWPFGWREFELRFTPARSGSVDLQLLGPWQSLEQQTVKQEVLWDAIQVAGAKMANGSFEQTTLDAEQGWKSQGGTIVEANSQIPAVDGKYYGRTWHDGRLTTTLRVTGGQQLRVRGFARAVFPAGFVEMRRIESRDTAAHRAAQKFRRGINLANDLEVPPGQDWGARHTAEDLEFIRQEGFDHVRIPIGWHHFTGPAPDYLIRDSMFGKADFLIQNASQRGLNVIINIHHFDAFTSNPSRERSRFLAIWRQLAERYAATGSGVAFELLNEPKDAATTEILNEIYAETILLIRRKNPTRTIFVGPGKWNAVAELSKLRLPDDETNVIVTVHSYMPMNFTHQGTSWTGPDYSLTGVQFPGPPETPLRVPPLLRLRPQVLTWISRYNTLPTDENPAGEKALVVHLQQAQQWSEYYGRPVHLGEFGVIDKADAASRSRYCRAVRLQTEAAGIGWALWDWKAPFRYWDKSLQRPMPGMREALFGKP